MARCPHSRQNAIGIWNLSTSACQQLNRIQLITKKEAMAYTCYK